MADQEKSTNWSKRLHKGDLVYLVEGEDLLRPSVGNIALKKATVAHTSQGIPLVNIWNGQKKCESLVARNAIDLFTIDEVLEIIESSGSIVILEDLSVEGTGDEIIDELIDEPIGRAEVTVLLGATAIFRSLE